MPVDVQESLKPLDALNSYEYNSRNHSKTQVEQLAAAISRFGFTQPIVINDKNTILAGHGRYEAAKLLQLSTVPCRVVTGLAPDEQRAYIIADNKLAEQSEWNHDNLLHELSDLSALDLGEDLSALLDQNTFVQIKVEQVSLLALKPHPKNYKQHPQDQLDHLKRSIADHGIYRNVIIAHDGTVLAGHGVVQAAKEMGLTSVPCLRTELSPSSPKALKLLTADNEISNIADVNAADLSSVLQEIIVDDDLLGTGYTKERLEALITSEDYQFKPTLDPVQGAGLDVTDDKIQKEQDKLNSEFSGKEPQSLVRITCPHCDNSFSVDARDAS